MDAVILAAGEGRRMNNHTDGIPKLFLELHGQTLYERQVATLEGVCDQLTVVLGYGFVGETAAPSPDGSPPAPTEPFDGEITIVDMAGEDGDAIVDMGEGGERTNRINREKIRRYLATDRDIEVTALVLPQWDRIENAESCRQALQRASGDVLLLNGDIVYSDRVIQTVLDQYDRESRSRGRSVVAVKEGLQDDMTAVRWDTDGVITDYGAIEGHQVAGIFVVNGQQRAAACDVLAAHPTDWFPVLFPAVESTYVSIPPGDHFEINTPAQFAAAKRGLARSRESETQQ